MNITADLDEVTKAYIDAALWSSHCYGAVDHEDCRGEDCDDSLEYLNYGIEDIDADTLINIRGVLADFIGLCLDGNPYAFTHWDLAQVGHDFWLTRNGHGAGFWDRGKGEAGQYLTRIAKTFGESDLCVGDDGKVYAYSA